MATVTKEWCRTIRRRHARARTIDCRRITKRELEVGRALYPEMGYWKPQTRGDCADVPRPCPYVSCKYNLYLDVESSHSYKLNFPDMEVWEMVESCSLDIADRGGASMDEVGNIMNLTGERIRQIERKYIAALAVDAVLFEYWSEPGDSPTKRRLHVHTGDTWGDVEDLEDMYIGDVVVLRKDHDGDGAVAEEFDELPEGGLQCA